MNLMLFILIYIPVHFNVIIVSVAFYLPSVLHLNWNTLII